MPIDYLCLEGYAKYALTKARFVDSVLDKMWTNNSMLIKKR